jgi:hypothetical protein
MMTDWIILFRDLGFFAIIIAGCSWVIKQYFEKMLDKDLEKFKTNLEKESIEFRIRYEKMHGDRVEVIKEVYKRIVRTYRSFSSLVAPFQSAEEPSQDEKGRDAANKANELTDYYEENKIYFDEKLACDIDSLLAEFKSIWADFQSSRVSIGLRDNKVMMEQWVCAWKKIQERIPGVKKQLEGSFRNILSINYEKTV